MSSICYCVYRDTFTVDSLREEYLSFTLAYILLSHGAADILSMSILYCRTDLDLRNKLFESLNWTEVSK